MLERTDEFGEGYAAVNAVAKHLGVHRTTIYKMVQKGILPTTRVGADYRIPIRAVKDYVSSRMRTATK